MGSKFAQILNFDIDNYLNPYIPRSRLSRLPRPISRFLGHRDGEYKEPPNLIVAFWSFIGALCGLLVVGALFHYAPGLTKYHPPVIIASMGASAVLEYSCIRSPLAQPRNTFLGQSLSAIIGVAISKGFQRYDDFDQLQWVAGAVCGATAALVMSLTSTVHPPGGATAVLAATNSQVIQLGWMFVPFVMLSSVMMLCVALVVNNIQRGYPVYWWTLQDLGPEVQEFDLEKKDSSNSAKTLHATGGQLGSDGADTIVIPTHRIYVPESLDLSEEEVTMLQRLQERVIKPSYSG